MEYLNVDKSQKDMEKRNLEIIEISEKKKARVIAFYFDRYFLIFAAFSLCKIFFQPLYWIYLLQFSGFSVYTPIWGEKSLKNISVRFMLSN